LVPASLSVTVRALLSRGYSRPRLAAAAVVVTFALAAVLLDVRGTVEVDPVALLALGVGAAFLTAAAFDGVRDHALYGTGKASLLVLFVVAQRQLWGPSLLTRGLLLVALVLLVYELALVTGIAPELPDDRP
jgi:hypothetical protein